MKDMDLGVTTSPAMHHQITSNGYSSKMHNSVAYREDGSVFQSVTGTGNVQFYKITTAISVSKGNNLLFHSSKKHFKQYLEGTIG